MPYGSDVSVYVEDRTGDQGLDPNHPAPWWISPDVDIPAHTGTAFQGSNDVQIRVHTHDEPILEEKIIAEVYVGTPSLVMSPILNTRQILSAVLFRPPGVAGTEAVADVAGGTHTFSWTPSNVATDVDGPGHRCLVVRAFPESVAPPVDPFNVPNEQHEAQHNLEIVSTQMKISGMSKGGAGTPKDPRRRDEKTGMWWEVFSTLAAGDKGKRFVVWAFDPRPARAIERAVRLAIPKGFEGFSDQPPKQVTLEPDAKRGEAIDPRDLLKNGPFLEKSGFGGGLFTEDRLLAGASVDLGPTELSQLVMRFDHSNLPSNTAVVLHGVQWDEAGHPEGGMTVVALAPV